MRWFAGRPWGRSVVCGGAARPRSLSWTVAAFFVAGGARGSGQHPWHATCTNVPAGSCGKVAASSTAFGEEGIMDSPVSDIEYDVLSTLQSKLESLEVYEAYLEDCEDAGDDEVRRLFEEIRD